MTSKYDPLGPYLRARQTSEVPMSFAEIEKVIGAPLPPKAVDHPAWWSNNTSNNTMTRVWLDAGFRTERVDIAARRLVFRRTGGPSRPPREPERPPTTIGDSGGASGGVLAKLREALAGTVRIAPGVSLTAPTGEPWDAEHS
jgi:hypothetical protein